MRRKKDPLVRVPIKVLGEPAIALIRESKVSNIIARQRNPLSCYLNDNSTLGF